MRLAEDGGHGAAAQAFLHDPGNLPHIGTINYYQVIAIEAETFQARRMQKGAGAALHAAPQHRPHECGAAEHGGGEPERRRHVVDTIVGFGCYLVQGGDGQAVPGQGMVDGVDAEGQHRPGGMVRRGRAFETVDAPAQVVQHGGFGDAFGHCLVLNVLFLF
ncbi:MAG: hypothetical protein VW405_21810 [Rhodospirillaceae bacterium]